MDEDAVEVMQGVCDNTQSAYNTFGMMKHTNFTAAVIPAFPICFSPYSNSFLPFEPLI